MNRITFIKGRSKRQNDFCYELADLASRDWCQTCSRNPSQSVVSFPYFGFDENSLSRSLKKSSKPTLTTVSKWTSFSLVSSPSSRDSFLIGSFLIFSPFVTTWIVVADFLAESCGISARELFEVKKSIHRNESRLRIIRFIETFQFSCGQDLQSLFARVVFRVSYSFFWK